MAYTASSLTKMQNLLGPADLTSPTPGFFVYTTADPIATVLGAGYFNAATTLIAGSIVLCQCAEGIRHLTVTGVAAGVVSVADLGASGTAKGVATTVTAADTIVTGLGTLAAVLVSMDDDPSATCDRASANLGNQTGAPAAGSFYLKTWMPTSVSDPDPVAATTFGKKVNWYAIAA